MGWGQAGWGGKTLSGGVLTGAVQGLGARGPLLGPSGVLGWCGGGLQLRAGAAVSFLLLASQGGCSVVQDETDLTSKPSLLLMVS